MSIELWSIGVIVVWYLWMLWRWRIVATYVDSSGSMLSSDYTGRTKGAVFYFDTEVHEKRQSCRGSTLYAPVVGHAREKGYRSIRVITDFGLYPVETTGLKVDWVIVGEAP
jgi:hypothetical protein